MLLAETAECTSLYCCSYSPLEGAAGHPPFCGFAVRFSTHVQLPNTPEGTRFCNLRLSRLYVCRLRVVISCQSKIILKSMLDELFRIIKECYMLRC